MPSVPPAIAKIAPDGHLTPRQRRHLLIEMSLRRARPGTGSSEIFLRERTAMESWPDLRGILQGIRWAVVGGVATRAYMPERMTNDLDVLVAEADGARALELLGQAGYSVESPLAIGGRLLRSPQGVEIDLLLGREPWISAALEKPAHDPAGYPVLPLPYLVLMKLASGRTQDTADLSRMLGLANEEQLKEVRAVVTRYSPQDQEDLESLIYLGRQETRLPSTSE